MGKNKDKDKKDKKSEKAKKGTEPKNEKTKGKKDKKASGENTDFTQKKYSGSIALSKLQHVLMKKKGKKGKEIKGIFIPIDQNCLVKGDEGAIYMNISIITKSPQDQYGQNGFIAQNGNKKWSEASEKDKAKFKELPILGNIKDFEDSKGSSNDTSGKVSDTEYNEEDDLPF